MKLNTKSLKDVEIGIPIVAEGPYHARIDKAEVKANKTGDGNNLVVMYRLLDNPIFLFKDGKEIVNNGQCVMTRYYSLKPTPDYDPDKNLKELAVAIKLAEDADLNVDDLLNKIVMVKVVHKDSEGKFSEGNDVQRVTPVKDDDTFTPPPF